MGSYLKMPKIPNNKALKKKYFKERMRRLIKLSYLKLLRIDDSTEKIARGAALGAFIGLMPTLGIGLILCLIGAYLLKVNKAAAIIASFVMNPFTAPLVWSGSIYIGRLIFWHERASEVFYGSAKESLFKELGHIPLTFVIGNTIIASFFSVIIYIIVKKGVIRSRARRAARKLKTREDPRMKVLP